MESCKTSRYIALFIAGIVLALLFVTNYDCQRVGIARQCQLSARLLYPLFHSSFLHAILNVWALLSVTFLYKLKPWALPCAYIIAIMAPQCALHQNPTIGLSAICYALFGFIVPQVNDKVLYNAAMAISIAVGLMIPGINGAIHLYAYIAGIILAIINHPLNRKYIRNIKKCSNK